MIGFTADVSTETAIGEMARPTQPAPEGVGEARLPIHVQVCATRRTSTYLRRPHLAPYASGLRFGLEEDATVQKPAPTKPID